MWGIISGIFLGLYCLMSYYIGRRGWTAFGKSSSPVFRKLYWVVLVLVVFAFPLAEIGEDLLPAAGGFLLNLWGGYSMIGVVYIFLLLLMIDLFRLTDKVLGYIPMKIKENDKTPIMLGVSVLVTVIVILAYGTWNARNPVVTEYDIKVDKQAGSLSELRIAMVSDIHYGTIIDAQRLESMVKIINELKPDLILFAGDIIEGSPTQAEARILMAVFNQMDAKYGKAAVPGNHDRALRDDSGVVRCFEEAGITVLRDNYIKPENSFYVIGRDDPGHGSRERKEISELMSEIDTSYPIILLDHQPIDLRAVQESNIDLQLSGHTHRGQVFPSQLITGKIFELDWGLLKNDDYHLVVSSGYGTWGPPLRIGNHPEVVFVKVSFGTSYGTFYCGLT